MTASCLQGLPSNEACGLSSNREQPIYSAPIPAIHIGCGWLTEAPRRAQVCRTDCTRESPSRHCIRGVLSQMLCGASPSSASTTFVDADYACPKDTLHYMRPAVLVHGAPRQYNATAHTCEGQLLVCLWVPKSTIYVSEVRGRSFLAIYPNARLSPSHIHRSHLWLHAEPHD